jgi:hypothetical protein
MICRILGGLDIDGGCWCRNFGFRGWCGMNGGARVLGVWRCRSLRVDIIFCIDDGRC